MEKFIFVSYSHQDMLKVESIIRSLRRHCFHVWYDENGKAISPTTNWDDFINGKIKDATQCIYFMSRDSISRPQVIRELKLMLELKKEIFTIMLEEVPFSRIQDNLLKDYFSKKQVMKVRSYGGVNREFIFALMKQLSLDCRDKTAPTLDLSNVTIHTTTSIGNFSSAYIYEDGNPIESYYTKNDQTAVYYKLTIGDTSPSAVFPCSTDNQWYPCEFYISSRNRHKEKYAALKQQIQRNEIMSALLHYQQILLNRAFVLNASFLNSCYWKESDKYDSDEAQAFAELISNGSICIYLMHENDPTEFGEYDIRSHIKEAWIEFCRSARLHCVKLDWNPEVNRSECTHRLYTPFYEFCVTLCDDPLRITSLMDALDIPREKYDAFLKRLIQVRNKVIKNGFSYTRNQFYIDFVTCKGTKVSDSIFDRRKPFAIELKKIIDLKYNCNFADACQCLLKEPNDSLQRISLMENTVRMAMYQNEMKFEDLSFAISEFSIKFSSSRVKLPKLENFTFVMINDLRKNNSAWSEYIALLDIMSRRANQWMVDFNLMENALKSFDEIVTSFRKYIDSENCIEADSAISIIYQIDNQRITTVYNYTKGVRYFESNQKKTSVGLSPIRIYFCYGDALDPNIHDSISSEILFYQGVTDISALEFSNKLTNYLKQENFEVKSCEKHIMT